MIFLIRIADANCFLQYRQFSIESEFRIRIRQSLVAARRPVVDSWLCGPSQFRGQFSDHVIWIGAGAGVSNR